MKKWFEIIHLMNDSYFLLAIALSLLASLNQFFLGFFDSTGEKSRLNNKI